jgi:hypothetical protein
MPTKAVICVGDIGHGAARIVGQSRGWPSIDVADLEAAAAAILKEDLSTALVLADRGAITASTSLRFSDTLARSRSSPAVSFLLGETSSAMEKLASRLPRTPTAEPNSLPRLLLIHRDFERFVAGLSLHNLSASFDGKPDPKPTLGADCAVLFMVGHSSGFDEGFEKMAICRRMEVSAPADFRAFPCFYGAACRFNQPVLTAFPTDIIAARKIVNIACWGFGLQDYMFAPGLTVGQGLLDAGSMESMITSIRVFPLDRSDLMSLYYLICHGLPFGRVTTLANKLRLQRGHRAEFFCFGDPEGYVERTQQEAECRWNGAVGLTTNLRSLTSSDMEIPFPEDVDQSDKIVLIGPESAGMACGLSASGYVFVSRSTDSVASEIVLRLLPVDDPELSVLGSPRQLVGGFHHLEHLARTLSALTGGQDGAQQVSGLIAAIDALRTLLAAWPLAQVQGGDVLRAAEISAAFGQLSARLDAIGDAFTKMYLALLGKGTPFLLLIRNDLGMSETLHSEIETCEYCGEPVDESAISSWTGVPSRLSGCCNVCGPIYDVSPGDEKWILSDSVRPNARNEFTINVRNAYQFPATAFAGLAIPQFGTQPAAFVSRDVLVPPGRTMPLSLELELPAEFSPGTYYAMGFVVLGTSVSLFRRPVIVRGDQRGST